MRADIIHKWGVLGVRNCGSAIFRAPQSDVTIIRPPERPVLVNRSIRRFLCKMILQNCRARRNVAKSAKGVAEIIEKGKRVGE